MTLYVNARGVKLCWEGICLFLLFFFFFVIEVNLYNACSRAEVLGLLLITLAIFSVLKFLGVTVIPRK